jgi:phenylalanyl-tRNA synthetase beta subunit
MWKIGFLFAMFIISSEQLNELNRYFLGKYIDDMIKMYPSQNVIKVREIILEAIGFNIKSSETISRYLDYYIVNQSLFANKPLWMETVLKSENYSPEDKLDHIQNNLEEDYGKQ